MAILDSLSLNMQLPIRHHEIWENRHELLTEILGGGTQTVPSTPISSEASTLGFAEGPQPPVRDARHDSRMRHRNFLFQGGGRQYPDAERRDEGQVVRDPIRPAPHDARA